MVFIGLLIMAPAAFAAPSISFTETEHDLGTVSQEKPAEYSFEFANTGDQPLIIEKVAAS